MGILLGSPLEKNSELLTDAAKCINTILGNRDCNIGKNNNKKRSRESEYYEEYNNLNGTEVAVRNLPSLESFMKEFYNEEIPVKIKGIY